ncbi:MAG: flippase [Candidatus Binataceae bacterium]
MEQKPLLRPSVQTSPPDSPKTWSGSSKQVTDSNDAVVTSSGSLIRNVLWTLAGDGSPILVAVFAIPILIHRLGNDRFGVLTLAWTIVGYFGVFDVGLGRALTKLIAEKRACGQSSEIPGLIHAALFLLMLFGAVGTILFAALSPLMIKGILKIPAPLQRETLYAFYFLALSLPAGLFLSALRGIMMAFLRFDLLTLLRIPFTLFVFLGPLMMVPFSQNLAYIVAILVGARFLSCLLHFLMCLRFVPNLYGPLQVRTPDIVSLLNFGGWITVSNIVGPVLMFVDRFLIGTFISIGAVTWYVTPYEMVTKLWLLPGAIVTVLFPAFSESLPVDPSRSALLLERATKYILMAMFPPILVVVTMAHWGVAIWLGEHFAAHATRVLQWLALGVLLNSLGQLPYALIQANHRPDITAKLHLIEVPAYLALLLWLIRIDGLEGAAIAWTLRLGVDTVALLLVSAYIYSPVAQCIREILALTASVTIVTMAGIWLGEGSARVFFLLATLTTFSLVSWSQLLSVEEKSVLRTGLKGIWALSQS